VMKCLAKIRSTSAADFAEKAAFIAPHFLPRSLHSEALMVDSERNKLRNTR